MENIKTESGKLNHKTMEEELERLGFKVINVKDRYRTHTYHVYAVLRNGYALSICQGIGVHSSIGKDPYTHSESFEVALGRYVGGVFYLIYKGKWKDDVLGWQTYEDVIELAKSVTRFRD
jgi:hypothetical protein